MSSLSALWITLVFVIIFLAFMGYRIVKSLFDGERAVMGIIFSLDNLRYTTMFMSFILTEYFGILAGEYLLDGYKLEPVLNFLAYTVVFATALLVSAVISTTLVHAERAIGEGNLSLKQMITVGAIYVLVAGIDFGTLVGGFKVVATELEKTKTVAIKKDVDKKDLFILNEKKKLYQQKERELKALDEQLSNPSSLKVELNDRAKKLKRELSWCKRKRKVCNTTKELLKDELSSLKELKVKELEERREKLFIEAKRALVEYEKVSNRLTTDRDKKFLTVKQTKEKIEHYGLLFALSLVMFNIVASIARSYLLVDGDDEEEHYYQDEPKESEPKEPTYQEKYQSDVSVIKELSPLEIEALVKDAMKEIVRERRQYISMQEDVSKINLNFSRDAVRNKMQELLDESGERKTFKIANSKLVSLVKKYKPEITTWTQQNSWAWRERREDEAEEGGLKVA